jgi:hypothetical protein
MKERVKELELDLKHKDEILAWDADKILEMAIKIVEKSKRIALLEAAIKQHMRGRQAKNGYDKELYAILQEQKNE